MAKKEEYTGVIRAFDMRKLDVRLMYYLIYAISLVFLVVCFFPLVWVVLSSFKTLKEFVKETTILPQQYQISSFLETWRSLKFSRYYVNSGISVAGSCICAVLFNGLFGYVLSRMKPAGHKVFEALVMWGLLIPSTMSIVPLFMRIARLHLTGSFVPLWLAMGANAFYVVLFRNFFDSLPNSLIEAAKIDGATDMRVFMQIAVPLSKSVVMVVILYAVTASWSDFLLPFLLLQNTKLETVMVKLFSLMRGAKINDVEMLRSIVFAIIPPIVLFIIFQKQITQVTIQSGIKG
ncbi:MAG: carbohydrate ABC transporter permease [Treponemataceae bacterium]|nr:carbohydrate ABC transporter permease [Treponemataceae bacterium]